VADQSRQEVQLFPAYRHTLEAIETATTLSEIESACRRFARDAGFTTWIYTAVFSVSLRERYSRIIGNHSPDWHARYLETGFEAVDPVMRALRNGRVQPLIWWELDFDAEPNPPAVWAYAREAAAYGLKSGISFPVRGPRGEIAALHFASAETGHVTGPRAICAMPYGQLIADYVHEAIERLIADMEDNSAHRAVISERQRECLFWAAEGKTGDEIARIMDVKASTVVFHLTEVQRRLGARNRIEAVARGIAAGLVCACCRGQSIGAVDPDAP